VIDMGISADQFWAQSLDGRAMLAMLARRGDVEIVRDVCDWLIGKYQKDVAAGALAKGATLEQAKIVGQESVASLQNMADRMDDRGCAATSQYIVDQVFRRHMLNSKEAYSKAMAWFANELRSRMKDDAGA
jgi:precorrin-4 methylase